MIFFFIKMRIFIGLKKLKKKFRPVTTHHQFIIEQKLARWD